MARAKPRIDRGLGAREVALRGASASGGAWWTARAGPYAAPVDVNLFLEPPALIGVCHLAPLPGAPRYGGSLAALLERAAADARALAEGGCGAILVENYGDVPFFRDAVPAETVAAMALCVARVREVAGDLPVGVNVLRNDARAALGLCAATGASFLRVNVLGGVQASDQGLLEGRAAELLRERARLAPGVAILADVHVKHSSPLGSETTAEAAGDLVERALADAVIVTGRGTGRAPSREVLAHVRRHVGAARVLVGSGLTDANAQKLLESADGAIVGSALEREGRAGEPVELARVRRLRRVFDDLRAERRAL